jgi:hypothetical protein
MGVTLTIGKSGIFSYPSHPVPLTHWEERVMALVYLTGVLGLRIPVNPEDLGKSPGT